MKAIVRGLWALSGFATALAPAVAHSAGFQLNEQSAPATGRVSAVTATIKDPSAIWHNPAGITHAQGTEFLAGVSIIVPDNAYEGPGFPSTNPGGGIVTADLNSSPPSFIPHVYAVQALSDRAYVGLGFYPSYGLGSSWEDQTNWPGRTQIEEIELRTFFFTPTVGLKLHENFRVAVGLQLVPATVFLAQTLGDDNGEVLFPRTSPETNDGRLELSGSAFGVGATLGIQATFIEHLKLGFTYRSAVDFSFDGQADFQLPSNVPSTIAGNFPDQEGSAELTVPHSFNLGVGWEMETWTVEAVAQLTLWDSFQELAIDFATGRPTPRLAEPRNWEVVPFFKLGGEYRLKAWSFRAGVGYDVTPSPDSTVEPGLADGNRFLVSGGVGYDFGPIQAHLAYMALFLEGRELTDESVFPLRGEFTGGVIHLPALSVGVKI
ncbi:MAG TPA: outer membrane protein transport protein [Myxococcales bacterium LLY-WYZ-16_1]|nr:outer membrane protein transport protein [Myxococcales bacterium LLY-WYZ-16_1]